MSCDLQDLVALMRQCEGDTREIIGTGSANMLAHWQQHEGDLDRLVKFIHDRIHSETKVNGWKLEQSSRLSLEGIVAFHCPGLFSPSDVRLARETLGK
jgi:hypothetical protein